MYPTFRLFEAGLTQVFVTVALAAVQNMGVATNSLHLDSSSFHVDGEYAESDEETESTAIKIQHGYSRDHRPDLKQFIVDCLGARTCGEPNRLCLASYADAVS